MLKFYARFEIDDVSGQQLTQAEVCILLIKNLKCLTNHFLGDQKTLRVCGPTTKGDIQILKRQNVRVLFASRRFG
jgi:hypothetical protein